MGTGGFAMGKALLAPPSFALIPFRPLIPGGRCSQGGVKVPTGGKGEKAQARERLLRDERSSRGRVSRFGVNPKPTVKVRMKENGRDSRIARGASFRMP